MYELAMKKEIGFEIIVEDKFPNNDIKTNENKWNVKLIADIRYWLTRFMSEARPCFAACTSSAVAIASRVALEVLRASRTMEARWSSSV